MDKGCFNFCLEQYNYYFDKSYKEQIESFKGRALTERRIKGISKSEFSRTIGVSNAYISSMRKSIDPETPQDIMIIN